MQSPRDIEHLMQRTRAYEYSDGLREIALGLLTVLMGLAVFGFRDAPPEVGYLGAVVVAALILASQWAMTRIRQRFTWPRTGYAGFDRSGYRRFQLARALLGLAAGIAVATLLILATGHANWITLALGIFALVFFAAQWRRFGQMRWLVLAFSAPLVALIIAILPFAREIALLAMMLYIGLGTLACGVYALIRYLRTAPAEPAR